MPNSSRPADFVGFCAQDWWYHNRAHSDFQLLIHLARTRKVLMINSIGMRLPTPGKSTKFLSRIWRKLKSMRRFVAPAGEEYPNVWVMSPISVPVYGNRVLRWANSTALAWQVRLVCKLKGFNRPHVMLTIPTALDAAKKLPRHSMIYNRSDKHSLFPEADTALIESFEEALFREADRVMYCSRELMREELPKTGGRAVFLDHGVVRARFEPVSEEEVHADVRAIPRPRIGYFGNIANYRVDVGIFRRLAAELPDAHMVLVGNVHEEIDDFLALPNVHHLGFRDHSEIPSIGSGFDVAIMPWALTDWIRYCNPIKMKEYLCLGLEAVSMTAPEVEHYADVLHVAKTPDEFIELVKRVLDGTAPAKDATKRADLIARSDWSNRAAELAEIAEAAAAHAG